MDLVEGLFSLDSNIDATQIAEIIWLANIIKEDKSSSTSIKKDSKTKKTKKANRDTVNYDIDDNLPKESLHEVIIQRAKHPKEYIEETFEGSSKIPTFVATLDDTKALSSILKYLENFMFKQNIVSKTIIDEEKTADYIVSTEIIKPIFKTEKKKDKYLTLNLIVDKHDSMFIWEEIINEFKKELYQAQVFKQINLISLNSSNENAKLHYTLSERTLSPSNTIFKDRTSLTLILSDIIGSAWKTNSVFNDLIDNWIDKTFIAIVSMLPTSFWDKTPLRQGSRNLVYSKKLLPKNSDLKVQYDFIEKDLERDLNRIPVISLEGSSLQYLSYILNAKKNKLLNAYIFESLERKEVKHHQIDNLTKSEAKGLVERFFSIVAPESRKLAIYCSVLPLHPKIIKEVIRAKKLGDVMETFTEFTFGGLLDRSHRKNKYKYYDFYPNIRRELMQFINMAEIESIYRLLDNTIKQVLGTTKAFIELLYEKEDNDEPIGKIEKELIEILIEVLKEKGSNIEKDKVNYLTQKINIIYPEKNWFMMGSLHGRDNEKPLHRVVFNYDFAIGKYPVTFEEYDLFCENVGKEKPSDEGWGRGRHPVVNITWYDAMEYCKWLSEKIGKVYRLPTEEEWEYCCRANTLTYWNFGNNKDDVEKYAWIKSNSKKNLHEVGKLKHNNWYLYDMHGLVWEWCYDNWKPNYNKNNKEYIFKVIRGGSIRTKKSSTQSSFRHYKKPELKSNHIGFRILEELG